MTYLMFQGWLICEDPACFERTRKVPIKFENNFPVCSVCEINSMYREVTINFITSSTTTKLFITENNEYVMQEIVGFITKILSLLFVLHAKCLHIHS